MTSQIVVTPAAAEPQLGADFPAPFSLDISSILSLFPDDDTLDDWFLRFASDNEDLGYQFEIDKRGRLLAMASEGLDGAQRLGNIYVDLSRWTETGVGGLVLTGNALVRVTGAGRRAPDAGWIAPDQLEDLPPAGQRPVWRTFRAKICGRDRFPIQPLGGPTIQDGGVDRLWCCPRLAHRSLCATSARLSTRHGT